ncbi:MAG: hypothetical protein R3E96_02300 [Planctomycetota bacterium]
MAVDAKGRLNLVVWLGTDRDALPAEPVDLALELLHRAQEQSPFILRHLEAMGVRCHGDLRLVLISDHFLESTVRKLAVLGPARLRLIEVHEVRSSSGASHHLVHRFPLQEEQLVGPEEFLDRLPAAPREVAAFVLERLRFIDDRVDLLACNSEALEWTRQPTPVRHRSSPRRAAGAGGYGGAARPGWHAGGRGISRPGAAALLRSSPRRTG